MFDVLMLMFNSFNKKEAEFRWQQWNMIAIEKNDISSKISTYKSFLAVDLLLKNGLS